MVQRMLMLNVLSLQGVDAILAVLTRIEDIARETPPIDNAGSRFGNPAFRTFYDKVSEVCVSINLPSLSVLCSSRGASRPHPSCTPLFRVFLPTPYPNLLRTSPNLGEVGQE
jgi:hypothetical protein